MENNVEEIIYCSEDQESFEPDAKTDKTRKKIHQKLKKYMQDTFGKGQAVNEMLKLQGLASKNFDYVSQVENFMLGKMNDTSVDPNANKAENNMIRVQAEAGVSYHKLIGHDLLYRVMKDIYGQDEAERLSNKMYSYDLYICDSSGIPQTYCYAINGSNLVTEGRNSKPLRCAPAKHLHSYISMLCGTIHAMSQNALMGACACGTVFFDSCNVLLKDGYTLEQVKNSKSVRKMISNFYQNMIYDFNDPTRSGSQTPFTNISIFDDFKIKKMLSEMMWYYDEFKVDMEYIAEYVKTLQELFCDIFDKGDPLSPTDNGYGMQFEFPVVSVNISKDKEGNLLDRDFVWKMCQRPINRYNLMVSDGNKIASCCIKKGEKLIVINQEEKNEIISINDFVEQFLKDSGTLKIDTGYKIKSYTTTGEEEDVKIVGVSRKQSEHSQLVKIVAGGKELETTLDHPYLVKNKETGEIGEVSAFVISQNPDKYLIAIED